LHLEAELDLGGRKEALARDVSVERVAGKVIRPPVDGVWGWYGGPGHPTSEHRRHIIQRFHYDLLIVRDVDGRPGARSGDPEKNESYFCWDKPF
jgi:hypothetical protein